MSHTSSNCISQKQKSWQLARTAFTPSPSHAMFEVARQKGTKGKVGRFAYCQSGAHLPVSSTLRWAWYTPFKMSGKVSKTKVV
eukprot:663374-Pleurochrysis_carterae.AAC.3